MAENICLVQIKPSTGSEYSQSRGRRRGEIKLNSEVGFFMIFGGLYPTEFYVMLLGIQEL
jgi:hypothetical protein